MSIQIEGFTALVGRSNIGKSAVVRALKAALTNELGTTFVRHEVECARLRRGLKTCKCQTTVHIVMEDFDLLWEKGDAVNRYTFNGQVYDSPGQGIPEFLTEGGFAPVKIGDKFGMIQVADQFFSIFLLNQSGPAVADAISDVARLDRINKAMRLVDKDKRENVTTRKVREKDVLALQNKLSAYEGLDQSITTCETAAARLDLVVKAHAKVTSLSSYVERSQDLVARIKTIWEIGKVPIPDTTPVLELWKQVQGLASAHTHIVRIVTDFKALAWVEKFTVPEVQPLVQASITLQKLDTWVSKIRLYRGTFEKIELAEKTPLPAVEAILEAHKKVSDVTAYTLRLHALVRAVHRVDAEYKKSSSEEAETLAEFQALGICPTCTQPFAGRHVHE